ncbi:hypothetical protein BZA05DRAFT_387223 [Tricharina praecox]|uniref:uncharacterized protein n=1 Tax=Tricharina praecox TaxID=43433 RepID=UPI00221FDC51|nr:uncharacterized protein BZA05DRAFT_387223 [Tricharina praecox]KAI5857090.1 hypothetical protein BZA05DRAFT_387223 [Tricharina praecox]
MKWLASSTSWLHTTSILRHLLSVGPTDGQMNGKTDSLTAGCIAALLHCSRRILASRRQKRSSSVFSCRSRSM